MLKHLHISNFTLIDQLDIDFSPGFSVITGETGAGKSIVLGAIGLLLGQRADTKAIKTGATKCVIEAHFDLSSHNMQPFFDAHDMEYDADDCIVRRELTASGKSRAFVNDTPAPLTVLKELGEQLIDIHSQHQNLLLGKHDFQLNVVDTLADDANLLGFYRQNFEQLCNERRALQQLVERIESSKANADFLRFQYDELHSAAIADGEQEELEQRASTMTHAEDIKASLYHAETLLQSDDTGIVSSLKAAADALQSIATLLPSAAEAAARLESAYIETKDIAHELGSMLDTVDFDPAELQSVRDRLDTIYTLLRKHRCDTAAQLLQLQESLRQQVDGIDSGDELVAQQQAIVDKAERQCIDIAAILTEKRTKAARLVEREMTQRLAPLGMPGVTFIVQITPCELGQSGADRVAFLFSANRNTQPQPISQVASGGEIARVMLSLKAMMSGAAGLPTIIFDEIDTGVSGKVAEQMAQTMRQMGSHNRQVISITHLPQIAALGQCHYKVYKQDTPTGTTSRMVPLTAEERVTEIAQMLSGSDITPAAISNAKSLLKQ